MATVTLRHITKVFGDNRVLCDFDASFREGEFITLLGPSGCGKTTLLRIIAGFERPTEGEVRIGERLVTGGKTFVPPEQRGIGMVFQSYAVWPHMNVFENVAYPLRIRRAGRQEIEEAVQGALALVHLEAYRDRLPSQLSGGQQQRVALARALVARPELLLLDEPLSNLDAKLRESMRFEIKELQQRLGITVVYVTHDQTEAMAMSDRIFLINQGVVRQSGTPEEIYNRPVSPFVADFLGKVDFFPGMAESGRIVFPAMEGQSIAYDGLERGSVLVAVRPENIAFSEDGALSGALAAEYYLGDTDDCRVWIGQTLLRVVAPGSAYGRMAVGQAVRLSVRTFTVFRDDGNLRQELSIRT